MGGEERKSGRGRGDEEKIIVDKKCTRRGEIGEVMNEVERGREEGYRERLKKEKGKKK